MNHLVSKLFHLAKKGIAFNVASKRVEWENSYMFHVPISKMEEFVASITRLYAIRHDYGCDEYTVYLYRMSL